jgi:hypothetical protein
LKRGTTSAIDHSFGKTPDLKEQLNIRASGPDSDFAHSLRTFG